MAEKKEWLTVADVARELSVHEQTVRRWLREGQVEGRMITRQAGYRIRRSELERVLEEGLREGKGLAHSSHPFAAGEGGTIESGDSSNN